MDAEDVPRVENDPMPPTRITMQWIHPSESRWAAVPEVDAVFSGDGLSPPSPLLLDYTYGVAVFGRWGGSLEYRTFLRERAQVEAAPLLPHFLSPPAPLSDDSNSDPDNPDDHDYALSGSSERLRAMDDLWTLHALLAGPISQEMQMKHDEKASQGQQASISKVEEWRSHIVCYSLFSLFHRYNSADVEYQLPL